MVHAAQRPLQRPGRASPGSFRRNDKLQVEGGAAICFFGPFGLQKGSISPRVHQTSGTSLYIYMSCSELKTISTSLLNEITVFLVFGWLPTVTLQAFFSKFCGLLRGVHFLSSACQPGFHLLNLQERPKVRYQHTTRL